MAAATRTLAPAHARRLVLGLLPPIFLGAIDGTIVPVALLTIGRELGDPGLIAWVMAGFLVAGTVATPLYGKLSDLHGRRRMLEVALALAIAGSVLCALASSMPMLVAARVLQGVGSGALFALAQAASADYISGRERGRYQAYFSGVFATAALAAPLLGGFLTQHLSWRAVFWVNLPLAALALWSVRRVLPSTAPLRRDARIDWLGAGLLTAGLAVPLVALARVGQGAPWLGGSTLGLIALGAALLALWVWREADAPEPIVPLSLFGHRPVLACCSANGMNFFVMIGSIVLLPLSMQVVGGARTDEVSVRLVALTLATPLGALAGGRLMLRTGWLAAIGSSGSLLAAAGLVALAVASEPGTVVPVAAMVPIGFGLGLTLPTILVAAQNAVGPALIGVVTATVAFFRSLGGVVGVAVLTSIVLSSADGGSIATADPTVLARAFRVAFAVSAAVALCAAAVTLRIGSLSRVGPDASDAARS